MAIIKLRDLQRREVAREDEQIVDAPALEAAVAEALAEHQRVLADPFVQPVAEDLEVGGLPVEVDPEPGGAARAVVGHRDVRPGVFGNGRARPDGEGVAGPVAEQTRREAPLLDQQVVAVRPGIGAVARLEHHRRLRAGSGVPHPEGERERRVAGETAQIGEVDVVLAIELHGLPGMSLDQRHLLLPRAAPGRAGREVRKHVAVESLEVKVSRQIGQPRS